MNCEICNKPMIKTRLELGTIETDGEIVMETIHLYLCPVCDGEVLDGRAEKKECAGC